MSAAVCAALALGLLIVLWFAGLMALLRAALRGRVPFPVVLAVALLASGQAHAWTAQKAAGGATTQVLLGLGGGANSGSADAFFPVGYSAGAVAANSNFSVFPVAGNITELRFKTFTAPSGSGTWTGTLLKNGSPTALACTINSGSSGKCVITGSIPVVAGDVVSMKASPANTPASTRLSAALLFVPTTANDTVIFAQALALSQSTTQAQSPSSSASLGALSTRRYNTFPDGGTIDKLTVNSSVAPSSGKSYAYTIGKNGSAGAVTCTIADTNTACADSTHSISVSAGDDHAYQSAPSGTPTSADSAYGARFVPTTAGSFPLIGSFGITDHATLTYYYPITGGNGFPTSTEAQNQNNSASMTITAIRVKLETAPGAGRSRVFTLRKNTADTALTCTIADTATTCNATGTISVADDDILDTSDAPTGTPTASKAGISYLAHR